jgi:hypothetical protein
MITQFKPATILLIVFTVAKRSSPFAKREHYFGDILSLWNKLSMRPVIPVLASSE